MASSYKDVGQAASGSTMTTRTNNEQEPFLMEDVTSTATTKDSPNSSYRMSSTTSSSAAAAAAASSKKTFKNLIMLFSFVFIVAIALILSLSKQDAQEQADEGKDENGVNVVSNSCPGNLVFLDCVCYRACDGSDLTQKNICGSRNSADCEKGCGCPRDKPFLVDSKTCSKTCAKFVPSMQKDFTDCPAVNVEQRASSVQLYEQEESEIFHIRLSPTTTCGKEQKQLDVLLHFTVLLRGQDCETQPKVHYVQYSKTKVATSGFIACMNMNTEDFDSAIRGAWFFYVTRLADIPENSDVQYTIGIQTKSTKSSMTRTFISPLLPGSMDLSRPILVLGDTATVGAKVVTPAAAKIAGDESYSLAIHVGDASYATNKGDCYDDKYGGDPKGRCGYLCTGVKCHGADKVQNEEMLALYNWAKVLDASLGGRIAWVSTMGNHDNDLPWFLTYRPPLLAAVPNVNEKYFVWKVKDYDRFIDPAKTNPEKQAMAMDLMKSPHFYSIDHGLMHVISLATEDNPINAYECWNGEPLSPELMARYDAHYGKKSKQYQWLVQDLEKANKRRDLVPWIAIYTHRPMYHTASHHAWCSKDGDWYACEFVKTYEPLLKKYGVNFFFTGHSHHYQRTLPMYDNEVVAKGTIHLLVGVGGDELTGDRWNGSPKWLATRQGKILGYARFWIKNSTSIYWEHISAIDDEVLDSAWFTNLFL